MSRISVYGTISTVLQDRPGYICWGLTFWNKWVIWKDFNKVNLQKQSASATYRRRSLWESLTCHRDAVDRWNKSSSILPPVYLTKIVDDILDIKQNRCLLADSNAATVEGWKSKVKSLTDETAWSRWQNWNPPAKRQCMISRLQKTYQVINDKAFLEKLEQQHWYWQGVWPQTEPKDPPA